MTPENSTEKVHSYRARWILPVDSQPIENGVVEITDGRISALHDRHDPRAVELGNAAVIPGLVNAHVHLEFSDLAAPLAPSDRFTSWIQSVVSHRRARAKQFVRAGRRECAMSGTTALAEIMTDEGSIGALREFGPAIFALREFIGLLPGQFASHIEAATRFLDEAKSDSPSSLHRGLSPHAPYSVHPELFSQLIDLAAQRGVLAAVHLAETREELELLAHGTGPFVEMLTKFGLWSEGIFPRGTRPMDYLCQLEKLDRGLVVHGNYLSSAELDYLAARPQLAMVYCPRTHAYFRHEAHPWLELLERGGSVAIGTDSRASNPDLSLWRELCFLREHFPKVDPRTLLKLGTCQGARALGLPPSDWSLQPESEANLTVIDFDDSVGQNPYNALFDNHSSTNRTMYRGRWFE